MAEEPWKSFTNIIKGGVEKRERKNFVRRRKRKKKVCFVHRRKNKYQKTQWVTQ